MDLKVLTLIAFVIVVGVVLVIAYFKVIKPLRIVVVDTTLREYLVKLVKTDLMPKIWVEGNLVLTMANRLDIEKASDCIFEKIVQQYRQGGEANNWFYTNKKPSIDNRFLQTFWQLPLENDHEKVVMEVYVKFANYAVEHPDASDWTFFGFMSWVNLNIDQVIDAEIHNMELVEV